MWKQNILIFLQCLNLVYVFCDGTYECGDHGRFEYCIDEIPGCIIGCHCHPGYYFDTDTKICEPNSKLLEHHRRHYVAEPTRLQSHIETNQNFVTSPVATTSKIDGAIDEISKDTEDLGDWLYNQFFKTIENQVINSTNDQNTLTRRSASAKSSINKRPKRRKKTKKRKKGKQKVKKQKLSQITENDSVFDISSGSNSDSSDSASSSSDSSLEYDRYYDHHADDDEHGHKKIVMIKKKPKQNLPNFIFLPNLDTPFYPPMGLPPPAIPVPMYPMVPVPPMVPFIHMEEIRTTAAPDKTTTEAVETPTTDQTQPTRINGEQENDQKTTKIPEQTEKKEPEKLRHLNKMRSKESKHSKNDKTEKNLRSIKMMSPSRQKFMQRLKQKMQNQSAKSLMPPWVRNKNTISNSFSKQDGNHEYPYLENSPDSYMINDIKPNTREDAAISENVDFKYITELIHRDDLNNNSDKLPPIEYNPFDSVEMYQSPIQKEKNADYIIPPDALDNRRFARPNYRKSDESYYMNLGRQIASMIRSIDTQNKELNIKVEATHEIPKNDLFVKVSSPRSYWERYVRSPLTFLNSNKRNFEYLKRSNELLFDIENKVEIIASTVPTLTLREIENIVSVMETAKRKMQDKDTTVKDVMLPENNLNINLWPQALSNARSIIKNTISANLKNHIKIPNPSPTTNNNKNKNNNIADHSNNIAHGFSMAITNRFSAQQNPQAAEKSKFKTLVMESKTKIKPASYIKDRLENYNQGPQKTLPNPKHFKSTFSGQHFGQPLWDHEKNPFFLKNRKYFDNTHNYFVNQNENVPYFAPTNSLQNSYFHHELSNFDHFE